MRVAKKPPEEKTLLVKTGHNEKADEHFYELYHIGPHLVTELKWDGKLSWYTPDGMRFQGAQSAIDYTMKEISRDGKPLTSGKYLFAYDKVDVQDDRIILRTKDGETVIIRSGKEL